MKKNLFLTLLCLIGLGSVQNAKAGNEIYATLSDDGKTLTLYYDDIKATRNNVCTGWITPNGTALIPGPQRDIITKAVLDETMKAARPTGTGLWFGFLTYLEEIQHLEYLNTSEVTTMINMFYGAMNLTSLDVSHFNTAKVVNMQGLFNGCSKIKTFDLSNFNVEKVTDTQYMFYNCSSLTTIFTDGDWDKNGKLTKSKDMFYKCQSLKGGSGTAFDSNHTDKQYARIDGGESAPGYFTYKEADVPEAAENAEIYAVLKDTLATFYYDEKRIERGGKQYWTEFATLAEFFNATTKVVFNKTMKNARPTSTYSWFSNFSKLKTIEGMEYLNTEEVTDMKWMFANCHSLKEIDLSHFNTSKAETLEGMFLYCQSLKTLNVSTFDMTNVKSIFQLFCLCENLETIYCDKDWTGYDIDETMHLFSYCKNLKGGKGTVYDETHNHDLNFARPDGGPESETPGYFTLPEQEEGQGINDIQGNTVQGTKVMRNGVMLIRRGKQTFTITGQEESRW